ncbi:MAG: phosphatidylserine decarboxylase [Chthoniobacterales bacterium]
MSKPRPARAMHEGRWIFLILIAGAILGIAFHFLILTLLFGGLMLFCLWFFREPDRTPPADPALAVSPADGTVTLVDEVVEDQFFKRRMKRVSIFLSVFDVHVNRTPIAGEVLFTEGRGGLYLDARKPEASVLNESLFWVFGSKEDQSRAVGVKQITGAIARRIVPWAQLGEQMERGERFGMIRFGSRTDLYLPLDSEILVSTGDKVKGGETAIAKMAL